MDVSDQYSILRLKPNEKVISIPFKSANQGHNLTSSDSRNSNGIVGILTVPWALTEQSVSSASSAAAAAAHHETLNMAILMHGYGGHKNYTFLKHTAQELSVNRGWYSFRFDFRNCGDSGKLSGLSAKNGRSISVDMEDLDTVVRFWSNVENYKHLLGFETSSDAAVDYNKNDKSANNHHDNSNVDKKLYVNALIAHSRGTIPMFKWSIAQWRKHQHGDNDAMLVRNLVNVSGRFLLHKLIEWMKENYPGWPTNFQDGQGIVLKNVYLQRQFHQDQYVWNEEFFDAGKGDYNDQSPNNEYDLSVIGESKFYSVLTMFGLKEDKIPIEDAYRFANKLHKVHKLVLVRDADHNYYGRVKVTEENAHLENPRNLPLNARGLVNYNVEVAKHISEFLGNESQRTHFNEKVSPLVDVKRWKCVEGINNFRDIGGYRIRDLSYLNTGKSSSAISGSFHVKPNLLFRSASTAKITHQGLQTLQDLQIGTIFDLRSDSEIEAQPFPVLSQDAWEKYRIKYLKLPMFPKTDVSPEAIFLRYENLISSPYTIPEVYLDFIALGIQCIRKVFEFVLQNYANASNDEQNSKGLLFHCAAGKDRTGVISMLLLLCAGLDAETVAREYELTTLGLKPELPQLKLHFQQQAAKFISKFAKMRGLENQGDQRDQSATISDAKIRALVNQYLSKGKGNGWDIENEGFANLVSSKYDTMLMTINRFNAKYGSVYQYMISVLGFTEQEVKLIKQALVYGTSGAPWRLSINL